MQLLITKRWTLSNQRLRTDTGKNKSSQARCRKIISLQRQARAQHHLRRIIGHLLQEDGGKVSWSRVLTRHSLWSNDFPGLARIAATTWRSSWSGSITETDLRQEAPWYRPWYQDSIKMSEAGEIEDTRTPRHRIHEYSFLSNNRLIARDQYEKLKLNTIRFIYCWAKKVK